MTPMQLVVQVPGTGEVCTVWIRASSNTFRSTFFTDGYEDGGGRPERQSSLRRAPSGALFWIGDAVKIADSELTSEAASMESIDEALRNLPAARELQVEDWREAIRRRVWGEGPGANDRERHVRIMHFWIVNRSAPKKDRPIPYQHVSPTDLTALFDQAVEFTLEKGAVCEADLKAHMQVDSWRASYLLTDLVDAKIISPQREYRTGSPSRYKALLTHAEWPERRAARMLGRGPGMGTRAVGWRKRREREHHQARRAAGRYTAEDREILIGLPSILDPAQPEDVLMTADCLRQCEEYDACLHALRGHRSLPAAFHDAAVLIGKLATLRSNVLMPLKQKPYTPAAEVSA